MLKRYCYIYGLTDPRDHDVLRYVGRTRVHCHFRLRVHLNEARKGVKTHRNDWIRSVLSDELAPNIVIIDEGVWSRTEADAREVFWIARCRELGADLTNATDGGDGNWGGRHSETTRRKMSMSHLGKTKSPETRARMAEAARQRYIDDPLWRENSRRMGLMNKGRKKSVT